jgi:hypothetical protein
MKDKYPPVINLGIYIFPPYSQRIKELILAYKHSSQKIKELDRTLGYFMKTVHSLRFLNEPELLVL